MSDGVTVASDRVMGIDLGGTKCAAGIVSLPGGQVQFRKWHPTRAQRGGGAVLSDVIAQIGEALDYSKSHAGVDITRVGIGIAELVRPNGEIASEATIRWKGMNIVQAIQDQTGLSVTVDADVRAAARGEALLGAGRGLSSFLFVTVGTGISASLVIDGVPYVGALGLTGTFASARGLIPSDAGTLVGGPPLEQYAAGPAIAARYAEQNPGFVGRAEDVCTRAEAGDEIAQDILMSSGRSLGAAIGQLVNMLDPAAVVVGGGLGMASVRYWDAMERSLRTYVWADAHREIPLHRATLGGDAGWIGAAIGAINTQIATSSS